MNRSILRLLSVVKPVNRINRNNNLIGSCCSVHIINTNTNSYRSRSTTRINSNNASLTPISQSHRSMFIQTQPTPNPRSIKFIPGRPVLGPDSGTMDFSTPRAAQLQSPLASLIFAIDGVNGVLLGSDFISVNISDSAEWLTIKPSVYAAIMDFYAANQPIIKIKSTTAATESIDENTASSSTAPNSSDSEVVAMIKELIETRIRPAVQEDGGDIQYCGFNESTGIVQVQMQGSCKGCSSSQITLKNGIENMLIHYVPEVKGVIEAPQDEELDRVSTEELNKLQSKLDQVQIKP